MAPVKDFRVTCEFLNEECTFSAGDTITGTVAFTLTKDTKVKSLLVKAKGDASVSWTEGSGDDERTYSAQRRYFKSKEYLIAEIGKGRQHHVIIIFSSYPLNVLVKSRTRVSFHL